MKFTFLDQVYFAKVALALLDEHKGNKQKLQEILAVGEMIEVNSGTENDIIYDTTEYIYEVIRTIDKDPRAFVDDIQRKRLEDTTKEFTGYDFDIVNTGLNATVGPPNFKKYSDTHSEYREELKEFARRVVGVINKNQENKEVLRVCNDLVEPILPILDFEFPFNEGLGFILDDWLEFLIDDNKQMADSQKQSIEDDLETYFSTKPIYSDLD